MEAVTDTGGVDFGSVIHSLATRAGMPSLTAFGVYIALQLLAADDPRPQALAFGLVGVVTTNGLAVWLARASLIGARRGSPEQQRGPGPTGTVAFLFTDIKDSTRLWEKRPRAMRVALRRHDAILTTAVGQHGGTIFSRAGDGFGAAFAGPDDAVAAALAAQSALEAEPWPAGLALRVRIGIHCGEADERDGDYFGPPVNRAARVMALAEPGTVLVTDVVVRGHRAAEAVEFDDRGRHRLRGVEGLAHLYVAARRESGERARSS